MRSTLTRYGILLALLAMLCGLAFGQAETGQIVGTVTDPQGAVIPNAKVTVKNADTNALRDTVTNSNGLYTVTNLQPGNYQVKVEAQNFTPATKQLNVSVGSRNTVDMALGLKETTTTVEVVGATGGEQVELTQQEISQVVNQQQITELPTLTRNVYDLVGTSGNVNVSAAGRGAGFSINGQRDASTDVLLDGGENVDLFTAVIGQSTPLDSVGEFRVITNSFSAEYGRASGGIVNVSTKQGSNSFHGTVYEFWRGAGLSSNTYDNNALMSDAIALGDCAGISDPTCPGRKPNFVRNQFGYSVGGPILKDKLFFFSSTEWIRVRSMGQSSANIVDPAFIANCLNFTDAAACGRVQAFYAMYGALKPDLTVVGGVPTTHDGVDYLQVQYPVPSDSGGGGPRNEYQTVARVDFNWTDKTTMYGRYALQSQDWFAGTVGESPYVGFDTGQNTFNNNILWNLTHIWGPNVVSQTKFVFNRLNTLQPLNGEPTPTLYMRATGNQSYSGVGVALPGYLPYTPGNAIPFGGPQNLYQIYQDLSWNVGKHQFRFGGQYIHTRDNRVFGAYEEAVEALGSNSAQSNGNFLAGNLLSFSAAVDPQGAYPCPTQPVNALTGVSGNRGTGVPIVTPACQITLPVSQPSFSRANRYHDFAFYAQDNWKLHPRFTLNLGVRWEYYGVQHNNDPSLDSNFFLGAGSDYSQQVRNGQVFTSTDAGNPVGGLWSPDYNNFAPRIGFAWDLFGDGKTSLRGGYGIAYERNFGNVTYNVIQNPPAYGVIALTSGDPGCAPTCPISTSNFGPLSGGAGIVNMPKVTLRTPTEDMSTAYSHMWSLALEREIAKNTVVALEYSGSKGVKQYSIQNWNRQGAGSLFMGDNPDDQGTCFNASCTSFLPATRRLNDQYTAINQRGQLGFSMYNGLNIRVQASNLHNTGLSFVSNYTWSHGIDNTSSTFSDFGNDFNLGLLNPWIPQQDKGDANFDIRHRWVFSGTWDTPWYGHDQSWWKKNLLGGWTLAPMMTVQTGGPFSLWDCWEAYFNVCPRAFIGDPGLLAQQGAHDVAAPEGPLGAGSNSWDYVTTNPALYFDYFNPVTFTGEWGVCGVGEGAINGCPYPGNMLGRNTFRTPGLWNMDLGVYKNLAITERFKLQFRGEFYNLMNHSNLYVLGGSAELDNIFYGVVPVTAVRGGQGTAGSERRNVQLGIKLIF